MKENELIFTDDDGLEEHFLIQEETKVNGASYILVTPADEDGCDEGEAYIMKDTSSASSREASYEFVEDEEELSAVADIFAQLLGDDTELIK